MDTSASPVKQLELSSLLSGIQQRDRAIASANAALYAEQGRRQTAEAHAAALQSQLAEAMAAPADLRRLCRAELDGLQARHADELLHARAEVEKMQLQLCAAEEQRSELRREIDGCRSVVAEWERAGSTAQQKLDRSQRTAVATKAREADTAEELNQVREKKRHYKQKSAAQAAAIIKLEANLTGQQQQMAAAEQELAELRNGAIAASQGVFDSKQAQ